MTITLGKLAEQLDADLHGDPEANITGIAPLNLAEEGQVSFLSNKKYSRFLKETNASAVIIQSAQLEMCPVDALVVDDPYLCFAKVVSVFHPEPQRTPGIHPSAVIHPSAIIDKTATISANVVIDEDVTVGADVFIESGCVIQNDVGIGEKTHLYPNVVLCHGVSIGKRVILHPGVVVGSDGFGIANDHGVWKKIPQVGTVMIGDDVEIGANTTVDRGALENTVIEEGAKIDNQVQIAHNVHIGAHTAIAGCVAIAGSTKIGKHCMIGGLSALNGHIEIADNVIITGNSAVPNSIKSSGMFSSAIPAIDARLWRRVVARLKNLDDLAKRVKKIEEK